MANQKAKTPAKEPKAKLSKAKERAAELLAQVGNGPSPVDAETRKTRLKNLIKLGKERGYLTYAEINDHLPDDVVDAEQIESIISTFNDMQIQVFDEAPAAEDLLMSDAAPTVADDEEVEEEAEQALSTVDSEFGRTTDPVRMYMREMGSVELLTREGEIEIAKRIEDGLKHMIQAISACPTTIVEILDAVAKIERDEMRIDELIDGLHLTRPRLAANRLANRLGDLGGEGFADNPTNIVGLENFLGEFAHDGFSTGSRPVHWRGCIARGGRKTVETCSGERFYHGCETPCLYAPARGQILPSGSCLAAIVRHGVARKQQCTACRRLLGKILHHPATIGRNPASACRNGDSAHLAGSGPQTGQKVNLVSAPTNH